MTLEQMRTLEQKYGDMVMRLAIAHLFDVGIRSFSEYADEAAVEDAILADRSEDPESHALLGEKFEVALCKAAWELSRTASPTELICWCERQKYFRIFEWEECEDED